MSQLHLLDEDGRLWGGFAALRRLAWLMPMLYPALPILYFPGMGLIGPIVYRFVAANRYLFHWHARCRDNRCYVSRVT